MKSGKTTLTKTLKVLDENQLEMDSATFHSALRPLSGDDLPIVGQTIVPNLYVNTGHGSKGWTLSFGSIKLLADIIDQVETEVKHNTTFVLYSGLYTWIIPWLLMIDFQIDPSPYSPKRFHPIRRHFFNASKGDHYLLSPQP